MAITGKTRVLAVWGFPVEHSLSPAMHNSALAQLGLDWTYVPFSVEPGKISEAVRSVRALNLAGVNVTIPHKEAVASLMDWVDPAAQKIGSVNTIVPGSGAIKGYSTDGPGLIWDLEEKAALPASGRSVLVLGAGGSARAAVSSLSEVGLRVIVANRTTDRAHRLVEDLSVKARVVEWQRDPLSEAASEAELIVNTTTLGMNGGSESEYDVLAPGCLRAGSVVYDLVYSPPQTPLMRFAGRCGARSYNGLGMLVKQGALSLGLWTGLKIDQIPVAAMEAAVASRQEHPGAENY